MAGIPECSQNFVTGRCVVPGVGERLAGAAYMADPVTAKCEIAIVDGKIRKLKPIPARPGKIS